MYLPADVPLVTPTLIDFLTRNRTEGLALVSAQRDGGTNALILNGGATLEFSFGPGSCRRHASGALRAGISVRMLAATEVQCDIDTPDDFFSLATWTGRGCQSQQFARDILQRQLGGQRPPESKHDIQSALS
jgi:2-phospho-L-lactate guanylyltransferase (CobY/MobA/RfbA family)